MEMWRCGNTVDHALYPGRDGVAPSRLQVLETAEMLFAAWIAALNSSVLCRSSTPRIMRHLHTVQYKHTYSAHPLDRPIGHWKTSDSAPRANVSPMVILGSGSWAWLGVAPDQVPARKQEFDINKEDTYIHRHNDAMFLILDCDRVTEPRFSAQSQSIALRGLDYGTVLHGFDDVQCS